MNHHSIQIHHFLLNFWKNKTSFQDETLFQIVEYKKNFNMTTTFVFQELLQDIEKIEVPYQEIVNASQHVSSYLNGTLQTSASQAIEKKLNDLNNQYNS